jgi:hypothetical protein
VGRYFVLLNIRLHLRVADTIDAGFDGFSIAQHRSFLYILSPSRARRSSDEIPIPSLRHRNLETEIRSLTTNPVLRQGHMLVLKGNVVKKWRARSKPGQGKSEIQSTRKERVAI